MYSGAWDERLEAVVPVCSVGNYRSYLGTACCQCEVVPGAIRFTDEWGLLGMVAPRALMVVNATQDAPQFSVPEAKTSVALAGAIFGLHDKSTFLRHRVFESKHDYNSAMRNSYNGNAMSIGNTRALGITATNVQCGCGREAIVDASGWLDTIEIPTLRWKDQRGFIVIAPVGAQIFVRWP